MPDEGYSRFVSCALNLISMFLVRQRFRLILRIKMKIEMQSGSYYQLKVIPLPWHHWTEWKSWEEPSINDPFPVQVLQVFFFMVFNTTFNNISVISWRSVLLVEETGVPGENHPPVASHWQTFLNRLYDITCHGLGQFRLNKPWSDLYLFVCLFDGV
jgi:hypothetical protein